MSFQKRPLSDNELQDLLGIRDLNTFNMRLNVYQTMKTISDDQLTELRSHQSDIAPISRTDMRHRGGMKAMGKRRRGTHRGTHRGSRKRRSCKKH